jgi:hypothetical protein
MLFNIFPKKNLRVFGSFVLFVLFLFYKSPNYLTSKKQQETKVDGKKRKLEEPQSAVGRKSLQQGFIESDKVKLDNFIWTMP